MKKYLALITSASLCLIASQAFAASKPPKDTIWEYKGTAVKRCGKCGSQNSTCKIVGSTKHYVAVLNRKSASVVRSVIFISWQELTVLAAARYRHM